MMKKTTLLLFYMALLSGLGGPSCGPALAAASEDSPTRIAEVLSQGHLVDADAAIGRASRDGTLVPAQVERLRRLVKQQAADADRLLALAKADIQVHEVSSADRRLAVALGLDSRVGESATGRQITAAVMALESARAVARSCVERRDVPCLHEALLRAAAIDPHDPASAMLELSASAWFDPSNAAGAQPPAMDGPTSAR